MKTYKEILIEEKLKKNDWIKQTGNNFENYAIIIDILKNKSFKVISCLVDDYGISNAKINSTKGWHPTPKLINEIEVPQKVKEKIMKKMKK